MKNIIVVGTGFSGSILARKIAEELNMEVLMVEKRSHIAGNMYDEYDDNGILIHRYGPHFLNTNKYFIIKYLKQFSSLYKHDARLMSYIDGEYVCSPYNFKTMQQLVGDEKAEHLLEEMRREFAGRDRVPILELMNSESADIREYAVYLFEKAFKPYVMKQWGLSPDEVDRSIMDRVPMAMNYDERYLNKDFQYLPDNGFTALFKNLLDHENITVQLNCNAFDHIEFDDEHKSIKYDGKHVDLLIFTGEIDALFSFKYGRLPYRSLDIRYDEYRDEQHLPSEIISYPQADGYTRQTEYKSLMKIKPNTKHTVVATEYPLMYDPDSDVANIPYYPILTKESMSLYDKYLDESKKYGNIFLCGRLAEFRYYNMDICIEHAFEKFEEIKTLLQ